MDRRELLQLGAATLAASSLAKTAFAQNAATQAAGFPLDVYSKHLQWARTPQEVAKAVIDTGLHSIDLTVLPYPGHVDPAKAKSDLPAFANTMKQNGVTVRAITCAITDADSPNAEAILDAASSAGIHHYSWSGFTYDAAQPYAPQLDALKPRVAKLQKLNQKYGMKALYQPKMGAGNVGSLFVDFLSVLQGFDPKFVAFRYDTAALLQASNQNFVAHMRLGAPYIGGVAINDAVVRLELPTWDQSSFEGDPRQLLAPSGGGDNAGNAGGNADAIGGGGRALPYRYHPVPVGTGMIDLTLIGKTLKDINFNGPAEAQIDWALGGAETGADKITYQRQEVIGMIKRDRLIIEQGFQVPWKINVAKPPFMQAQESGAPAGGGRGAAGAAPAAN